MSDGHNVTCSWLSSEVVHGVRDGGRTTACGLVTLRHGREFTPTDAGVTCGACQARRADPFARFGLLGNVNTAVALPAGAVRLLEMAAKKRGLKKQQYIRLVLARAIAHDIPEEFTLA